MDTISRTSSPSAESIVRPIRRSDGILNFTSPVKLVIDCSSDGRRAAYICLLVSPPEKPRLIYGTARGVPTGTVEMWGIRRAIRRANTRYGGQRPLLVFTDNLSIVETRGSTHVQYRWLSRNETLMQHLHKAANSLRRSMQPGSSKSLEARQTVIRMSSNSTVPNGKTIRPPLSQEEQAQRRKAIEIARASNQLSGFEPDPAAEALNARYIAGELTSDELTAAILALAGLPVPDR